MKVMIKLNRFPENPLLQPDPNHQWEHDGAFNGCVAQHNGTYNMVYRALSSNVQQNGYNMRLSSVGYAKSIDGINFGEHQQIIKPEEDWEIYGCEDPRITLFNNQFYIFYTALSVYPFAAYGIKLALAKTSDFQTFEKHQVTTFNSKAMALFPQKINNRMAALVTINTDLPPAKIAVAFFDREEDIWSPAYWEEWYDNANSHILHLLRDIRDQIELGSPPIKTPDGWLVFYSYIRNYLSNQKDFGVEAVLLDLDDPRKIIGRTNYSLINPEADYELHGDVPNIVFPSAGVVNGDKLILYYGAADTRCAAAWCNLEELLNELKPKLSSPTKGEDQGEGSTLQAKNTSQADTLSRYSGNPILTPAVELEWQAKAVYNPAAFYEDGKVHIVYRAQSMDNTSVFGYAESSDGLHIDENLDVPIYFPRESFEQKTIPNGNSGCEDPRITRIGDRLYMTYTAFDGTNPPRVALTSIAIKDFLKWQWNWDTPKLISLARVDDKDACITLDPNTNTYLAFHRLGNAIWLDILDSLSIGDDKYLDGKILAEPRKDKWDNTKIGISAPPIETDEGWLLLYHGITTPGNSYAVGALLLDKHNPFTILGRSDKPLLQPEMPYELQGQIPNVVFPCGAVVIEDRLYVYYGGADSVIGVATMPLQKLIGELLETSNN
jgi:predicted GH43/DUF377 family glycosyl hydrolase